MDSHCWICEDAWDIRDQLQAYSLCLFQNRIYHLLSLSFETGVWKKLTHRPAIEIICVIVHDVVVVFLWVIIRSMRVVGFCMPF